MAQKALVLEIGRERILLYKSLMDESDELGWKAIERKHRLGLMLIEDKRNSRHGKFKEIIQMIAQSIHRSWQELYHCKKFADIYPSFSSFQEEFKDDERAKSWYFITSNLLYRAEDDSSNELELSEKEKGVLEESYQRSVINWPKLREDNPKRWQVRKWLVEIETEYAMGEGQAIEEALFHWETTVMKKVPPMDLLLKEDSIGKNNFVF